MHSEPTYLHTIQIGPSWRTRALNGLLRLTMRRRLTQASDVAALRREYEEIDARYFRLAPDVRRTPGDCGGVSAEWITVPVAATSGSSSTCTAGHSRSASPTRTRRWCRAFVVASARAPSSPITGWHRSTRFRQRRTIAIARTERSSHRA